MKSFALVASALVLSLAGCSTTAPSAPAEAPPAHASQPCVLRGRLRRFVGEWRSSAVIEGEPGTPSQTLSGTERSRSLGGLWVVSEIRGESPTGAMEALMSLGYDPEKQRFVGTWVDSMTNHMWIYEGSLDSSGRVLTLQSKGPSFAGDGTLANYRDAFEFKADDHKVLTSSVEGPDGKWTTYLTVDYRRTK